MTSLRHAFAFLTILPVGPHEKAPTAAASAWFPLVGLALGGLLAGLDVAAREGLPMLVVGAILLAASLIATRAIHVEGFLDSCDGLFGGRDKADRLKILRDSHVGAFAVVGGACLLFLKWTLLVSAPVDVRIELLALFPCISRLGMLTTMTAFKYVRERGLGASFTLGRSRWHWVIGFITTMAAAVLLMGNGGLIILVVSLTIALAFGWWISRLIGGMTGDTYGAVNEVTEVSALFLAVLLIPVMGNLFGPPLW